MRVLGLMSGTSADGVDAVLAEFAGSPSKPIWTLLNCFSLKYDNSLRDRIVNVGQGQKIDSSEWLSLTEDITEFHAEAALRCDPFSRAEIVGCHGQTVFHRPPEKLNRGGSLQLLGAQLLAQIINKPVIHDFRSADLALQGQGAPLVPLLDEALLGRINGWRSILNLGGISNITLIPPKCGPDVNKPIMGWDCGPANSLIDLAVKKLNFNNLSFDKEGSIASSGSPDFLIIEEWLKEPFFNKNPPKSTGREYFGLKDLMQRLEDMPNQPSQNIISTLTAFSAAVIAQEINNLQKRKLVFPIELLLAGGGSRNEYLVAQITHLCNGLIVRSIEDFGIPVQAREALGFALLAWWHIYRHPGTTPSITGVKRPVVLGMRANPG